MFRKDLIDLLLDKFMSVPQIAHFVGESPKNVAEDLRHLILSLKHTEYSVLVIPAECRKCGFEFSTDKLRKPSKCPQCYSTWISGPEIGIRLVPAEERTQR